MLESQDLNPTPSCRTGWHCWPYLMTRTTDPATQTRYMNPPPPPAPAMAWSDKGGMQWLHDSADGRLAMLHNRAVRSPDHLDRLGFSPTTVTRQSHKADHGFPVVQVPFGILPGTTPITSRTHYGDLLTLLLRFLVLFLFFWQLMQPLGLSIHMLRKQTVKSPTVWSVIGHYFLLAAFLFVSEEE